MSALMIATITVKDPAKFQDYIAKTSKVAATFGAELLYRGKIDKSLTGEGKDHEGVERAFQFRFVGKEDRREHQH